LSVVNERLVSFSKDLHMALLHSTIDLRAYHVQTELNRLLKNVHDITLTTSLHKSIRIAKAFLIFLSVFCVAASVT
jgi:hypothetical protein